MQKYLRALSLWIAAGVLLSGCNIHRNSTDTIPTQIIVIPTNTLAPIITTTMRFTATLLPSDTPIPSITPIPSATDVASPVTDTAVPTITLMPGVRGTVSSNATLRSGPSKTSTALQTIPSGTTLTVLGVGEDRKYYNVRLDDDTIGWIAQNLLSLPDGANIPVLTSADQTTVAQITPGAPSGTSDGNFLAYRDPRSTDVLAYCDTFAKPHKTYPSGTIVTIWWSWFAQTAQQIQDHVTNAQYNVQVDGKPLVGWATLRTNVIRQSGKYFVYYYVPVPLDTLTSGEHKITYEVTWKAPINDGTDNWGPGTGKESDTGTCAFTIK